MKKLALLSIGSLLLLTGCFDIELGLVLEEDLSGTVGMTMSYDMEPMAYIMASMEKAFSGDDSPPTAEEIEAAKQKILADEGTKPQMDPEEMRRDAAEKLPEGFELIDANMEQSGLKTTMHFRVSYPHIDRLHELKFEEPGREMEEEMPGTPTGENFGSISEPFQDLKLTDEGDTYLLESGAPNPVEDMESGEEDMMMPGMEEMIGQIFKGLRVAVTIEVPGDIIEQNATRVEGRKLYWEYDLMSLESAREEDIGKIRVRFKK